MRIYIERDGRPYNYLSSLDELNHKREDHLKVEESEMRENLRKENEAKDNEVKKSIDELEKLADKRWAEIKKHMQDLEQCDKLNMR